MTDPVTSGDDRAASKPNPSRARLWSRRLLKATGLLLLLGGLGVAVLPTVVTSRFVIGQGLATANAMFPGTIELESVRFGWRTPFFLRNLRLTDRDGKSFLALDEVSFQRSILGMVMEEDRLGLVAVRGLKVNLVQRADGSLNYADFIPPADPNAAVPPPPPTEPFVLQLSRLIPVLPLPTTRLAINLDDFLINYTDESDPEKPPVSFRLDKSSTVYTGGTAPLVNKSTGSLSVGSATLPWLLDLELAGWTDGSKIDVKDSNLSIVLDVAHKETEAPLLRWDTAIEQEKLSSKLQVNLAATSRFESILPPVPSVAGDLHLELMLDTADNPARVESTLAFIELAASDGTQWVLRPATHALSAKASIDRQSLQPTKADLEVMSPFAQLTAALIPTEPERFDVSLNFAMEATTALGLLDGELLRDVPAVDAGITLEVEGSVGTDASGSLITKLALAPRSVDLGGFALPENMTLIHPTLRLEPLGVVLEAHTTFDADGDFASELSSTGPLHALELKASKAGNDIQADATAGADLTELGRWLEASVALNPRVGIEGNVALASSTSLLQGQLQTQGTLSLPGLVVSNEFIPNGVYQDTLSISWGVQTDTTVETFPSTAELGISSNYAKLSTNTVLTTEGPSNVLVALSLQLEPLIADFARVYMPTSPLVEIAGALALEVEAATTEEAAWTLKAAATTSEDFVAEVPEMGAYLKKVLGGVQLVYTEKEGRHVVDDIQARWNIQDALSGTMKGNLSSDTTRHAFDLTTSTTIDWLQLSSWLEGYLAVGHEVLLASAGSSVINLALAGDLDTSDTLVFHQPLKIDLKTDTTIDELMMHAGEMEINLVAMTDTRDFGLVMQNADPLQALLNVSGRSSIGELFWSGGATLVGLLLEDQITWNPEAGLSIRIPSLGAEFIDYRAEGNIVGVPFFKNDLSIAIPPSLAAAKMAWTTGFGEASSLTTSIDWARTTPSEGTERDNLGVELKLQLPLAESASLERGGLMASIASRLDGLLTSEFRARVLREGSEGDWGPATIQDYDGSWMVRLDDFVMESPSARLADGRVSINLYTFDKQWYLDAEMSPGLYAAGEMDLGYLKELSTVLQIRFTDYKDFFLDNFIVDVPGGGSTLELRGEIRDFLAMVQSEAAGLEAALATPMQLFYTLRQDFGKVTAYNQAVDGEGVFVASGIFENLPGKQATLDTSARFENAAIQYADMMQLKGLHGDFPYTKRLFEDRALTDRRRPLRGKVSLSASEFQSPPYTFTVRDSAALSSLSNTSLMSRTSSSDFFGGTFDSTFTLRSVQGDPVIEGDFAITGFDGASFLPSLNRISLTQRGFDAFGFTRVRFRENSTVDGLMDDLVFRADITSFGREFLAATIRMVDPQGANAGLQSLNAMLPFSYPERGFVDLRGALLSSSIRLTNDVGISIDIPVFDRSSIANLLEPYFDPSYNDLLALARLGLSVLLTESLDDLRAIASDGETP